MNIVARWIEAFKRWVRAHIVDDWPFGGLMVLCLVAGISSSAHAAQMQASWYSRAALIRDGQDKRTRFMMANGKEFRDEGRTCASWDYAIGTHVLVKNVNNGKSVVVEVTDRTARRFKGKRIDLCRSVFTVLAPLPQGVVSVTVEVIR